VSTRVADEVEHLHERLGGFGDSLLADLRLKLLAVVGQMSL